ncbi:MAG: signal peptidase I [Lachnospiraceae bacterium]|nr:signal peptidase I [Lachnospiraceae bacterium]
MSKKIIKEIFEWIMVVVIAAAAALFITEVLIVNATVPTQSMETTIMAKDRLIGSRLSYKNTDPARGDIIIFKYPDNEEILFIKRVIGLPGEIVDIHDGNVYINGEILNEPYLTVKTEGKFGPYEVPEGHFFMLGDNRNNSADSRYWENPYLSREGIVGKALFKYWKKFEVLNGKEAYNDI